MPVDPEATVTTGAFLMFVLHSKSKQHAPLAKVIVKQRIFRGLRTGPQMAAAAFQT